MKIVCRVLRTPRGLQSIHVSVHRQRPPHFAKQSAHHTSRLCAPVASLRAGEKHVADETSQRESQEAGESLCERNPPMRRIQPARCGDETRNGFAAETAFRALAARRCEAVVQGHSRAICRVAPIGARADSLQCAASPAGSAVGFAVFPCRYASLFAVGVGLAMGGCVLDNI